jgi:hypothetical protein
MIDRAAIFTALTKRNALRRAAQLPLLDLRQELARAVDVATWQAACAAHADDLPRLRQEVLAELQETRGADFDETKSAGARWLIDWTVKERFRRLVGSAIR